jgi:ABC-type bacteriocin/lantibiotic exporter with double-glycine peptidase domain
MAKRTNGNPGRARGGIFAAETLAPYMPKGAVVGQLTPDSCVAGISRMLLRDLVTDVPEAHLCAALQTDWAGTDLHQLPAVLKQFGLPLHYIAQEALTLEALAKAVTNSPAIVTVKVGRGSDLHAVIVDEIGVEWVAVRDPLPEGRGSAYRVRLDAFLRAWFYQRRGRGFAVVVESAHARSRNHKRSSLPHRGG